MNIAIIVGAGTGSRVGASKPKQYLELAGKPIIFHTIEKFEKCKAIDEIVLVIGADQLSDYRELAHKYRPRKVKKIVFGGATRFESVCRGLAAVVAPADSVVAIHDAARPFVTADEIKATLEAASETGAACLTTAVTDTIKQVFAGRIATTIDRLQLRRALTPQAFKLDILREAILSVEPGDAPTDECMVLEQRGIPVALVEGSSRNIKITNPEDLLFAELLLGAEKR